MRSIDHVLTGRSRVPMIHALASLFENPLTYPISPVRIHLHIMMLKKLASMAAVALLFIAGTNTRAQENPVIGVLRISSLDDLRTSVGAYAEAIQAGSSAQGAMLPAVASQYGIDTAGEISAVLLNPQVSSAPYAIILPVVNSDAVAQNPELGFAPTAEDAKIFTFNVPGAEMKMYATFEGRKLIASPLVENINLIRNFVAEDSLTAPLKAGGGQIALGLAVDKLWSAYKPMVDLMLGGMAAGAQSPESTAVQAQAKGLVDNIGQLQGFALRMSFNPDFANLSMSLTAKPNTNLAAFLKRGPSPAVRSPGVAQANCAIIGSTALQMTPDMLVVWKGWLSGYMKMMSQVATGEQATVADMFTKLEEFAASGIEIWDGTCSFGILPDDGGFMRGTYGVTDPAKAKDFILKSQEQMNSLSALMKDAGSNFSANLKSTTDHNGTEIFEFSVSTIPKPDTPKSEVSLKVQESLGIAGDNIPAAYAVKNNDMVFAQGKDAVAQVKTMVDQLGTDVPAVTAPTAYGFAENPTVFFAASAPRIMKNISKAGALNLGNAEVPIPAKPGIAGAIVLNNALELQLSVGSEDIRTAIAMQPVAAPGLMEPDSANAQPEGEDAAPDSTAPESQE